MKGTQRQFVVFAGATSLIGMQMFGSVEPLQNHFLKQFSTNLGLTSPAIASYALQATSGVQYVPPVGANPQRSRGSGSRGCDRSIPVTVTLLIPTNHIGLTTSGHPSFFWNLSDNVSVPVKFALVKPGVVEPVFVKQIDSPKAGIMAVEMPENLPELVPGQQYRWSVSLICNRNRPSANPYFYTWIKRVPTTPALTQKLATTHSNSQLSTDTENTTSSKRLRDRAQIYAQAGQWYDALATLAAARAANPDDASIRADFLSLLKQAGLTNVATQEGKISMQ